MRRKPITERMKIDALLHTAFEFFAEYKSLGIGHVIFCPICLLPILPGQPIDWDHAWAVGLDGPHIHQNIRPMHHECHRKKTFGTKATTAGSDIGKISKAKRIERTGKMVVVKSLDPCHGPEDTTCPSCGLGEPKRPWPKGRKLPSRPFQKKAKVAA